MAAMAPARENPTVSFEPIRTFIVCDRCGGAEAPGLTRVTSWGVLCMLCRDDHETAHGAGEEGF